MQIFCSPPSFYWWINGQIRRLRNLRKLILYMLQHGSKCHWHLKKRWWLATVAFTTMATIYIFPPFSFLVLCLDFVLCNQVLAEQPIRRNVQAEKEIANFLWIGMRVYLFWNIMTLSPNLGGIRSRWYLTGHEI